MFKIEDFLAKESITTSIDEDLYAKKEIKKVRTFGEAPTNMPLRDASMRLSIKPFEKIRKGSELKIN